ncbi:MAG: cysteine synthase A [Firmicutes bacterium]|nr:cysteine synthase A [Bacillota bacterium]
MPSSYSKISELIGNTPLVQLENYAREHRLGADILAKLEYLNPAGSIKDRVALGLVEDAQKRGLLKPGGVIVEPTSGNTGIGLAALSAYFGYRLILTMPDSMSVERQKLLRSYGAELVLTDGSSGMRGAIEKAEQLLRSIPGAYMPNQFFNPANPAVHFNTTGPEIWAGTDCKIDIFVAGVGTGGTISGVGQFLKSKTPAVRVVAVEPASSSVLSGGAAGAHGIMGIGAGFVPDILDRSVIDEVIAVSDADSFSAVLELAKTDGVFVGISSGAALSAAKTLALKKENKGKQIVVIFPDSGERYLSVVR